MKNEIIEEGFAIVVADRGFVYVGHVEVKALKAVITNARNIRRWGTRHGLLQLAENGTTENTILDGNGSSTVHVPINSICHIIETREELWM